MNERKHLQITAEELDEVEAQKKDAALEFSAAELDQVQQGAARQQRRSYPSLDDTADGPQEAGGKGGKVWSKAKSLVPTGVAQLVTAGLLGALTAWLLNELFFDYNTYGRTQGDVVLQMGFWGAFVAAVIGFFFGAVQDFLNRHYKRAALSGLKWAGGAAAGGFLGGLLGQYFYGVLDGGSPQLSMGMQVLARTIGWGLLGTGLGLGHGGMTWNRKRLVNGLLGGLIGGVIGGLLFDFVAMVYAARAGAASRLIGFLALGGMIGFLIGMVEHLRREVWLAATAGPMEGKQFILFGTRTTFGSAGKADIILHGDPSVPPLAFQLEQGQNGSYSLQSLEPGYQICHNDVPKQQARLRGRDRIRCGKHQFAFHEKIIR